MAWLCGPPLPDGRGSMRRNRRGRRRASVADRFPRNRLAVDDAGGRELEGTNCDFKLGRELVKIRHAKGAGRSLAQGKRDLDGRAEGVGATSGVAGGWADLSWESKLGEQIQVRAGWPRL